MVISPTVTVIRNTTYIMLPPIIDLRATAIIFIKPRHFYWLVYFKVFFYISIPGFPIRAKLFLNFL